MTAKVKVLVEGYTNADAKAESGGEEKSCATISLIRDGDLIMVVDPGVLDSQQILIIALREEGIGIKDVDIVCLTHSHIDHYRNIGMFPDAKTLEFFGLWDKGVCENWQEQFSENIQILKTPGHDYTSITFFVTTADGIVAICGDVFWKEDYPEEDGYALDSEKLKHSRSLVLNIADWVIPGHGGIYKVNKNKALYDRLAASEYAKKSDTLIICRNCKKAVKRQEDRCLCQPFLCYHCCQCDMDCNLCSCKHKR